MKLKWSSLTHLLTSVPTRANKPMRENQGPRQESSAAEWNITAKRFELTFHTKIDSHLNHCAPDK